MINRFNVAREPFGVLPSGELVSRYWLSGPAGARVAILDFGGIIQSLHVPNASGELGDVVLGFDELEPYLDKSPYIGALIGRFGNRIANGRFELDGKSYELDVNNGPNHLHGGLVGFDKCLWEASASANEEGAYLRLSLVSPDGDQGYPGELSVEVVYALGADNDLTMEIKAQTDKPTVINMTQHSYFNLTAPSSSTPVFDHSMQIFADSITPVDANLIPTGAYAEVNGSPFDFTQPSPIGYRIREDNEQLKYGRGYDHNYVLRKEEVGELSLAARVVCAESGRTLELHTTEPGVQFYTGNFLDSSLLGKVGAMCPHAGFCLEPQHFPDSPNKPQFASTELRPGEQYRTKTVFVFGVED